MQPFGSYVAYIPPTTTEEHDKKTKFDTSSIPGIFLNYCILPNGQWKEYYHIVPLSCFDKVSLLTHAKGLRSKFTKKIIMSPDVHVIPGTSSWFPLLDRSNFANKTLDGNEVHRKLERDSFTRPPPPGSDGIDPVDYIQPKDPDSRSAQPPCEAEDGTLPEDQGPPGDDLRIFPQREYEVPPHQDVSQSRQADETNENSAITKHTSSSSSSSGPPIPPPASTLPKYPKEDGETSCTSEREAQGQV